MKIGPFQVSWHNFGKQSLKNVSRQIRVYQIVVEVGIITAIALLGGLHHQYVRV